MKENGDKQSVRDTSQHYLRSWLNDNRADLLQSLLCHVFTLCRKLRLAALEVFILKQHHLVDREEETFWTSMEPTQLGTQGVASEASINTRLLLSPNHTDSVCSPHIFFYECLMYKQGFPDQTKLPSPDEKMLGYLICSSSSTLALPSSQLLWGTLLLRHPPDPLLLHFLSAAHTQTGHHPSCMYTGAQRGKIKSHRSITHHWSVFISNYSNNN